MGHGVRKTALLVAVLLVSSLVVVPSHATPPNSQTQTWQFIGTPCSVTQSWSLQPSTLIADRAVLTASVSCAKGVPAFALALLVIDETENSRAGYDRGSGDAPYNFVGTGTVQVIISRPPRHLYVSETVLSFPKRLTGPAPCPIIGPAIPCTLAQSFMPLDRRPVAPYAPEPTPVIEDFGSPPCDAEYTIYRAPPTGITLTVYENCGGFTLTLYADRQETIPLAQVGTCLDCTPSTTFLLAPEGRTFTVAFRGYFRFGDYPPQYVSDDRNIVVAN